MLSSEFSRIKCRYIALNAAASIVPVFPLLPPPPHDLPYPQTAFYACSRYALSCCHVPLIACASESLSCSAHPPRIYMPKQPSIITFCQFSCSRQFFRASSFVIKETTRACIVFIHLVTKEFTGAPRRLRSSSSPSPPSSSSSSLL